MYELSRKRVKTIKRNRYPIVLKKEENRRLAFLIFMKRKYILFPIKKSEYFYPLSNLKFKQIYKLYFILNTVNLG